MATARSSTPVMRPTGESVRTFLASVPDAGRRETRAASAPCSGRSRASGPSSGPGASSASAGYHYRYASGHEGDAP